MGKIANAPCKPTLLRKIKKKKNKKKGKKRKNKRLYLIKEQTD